MSFVGNSDLRLPMFISAILLSIVKAILIVLVAAVLISKITAVNAQTQADDEFSSSYARNLWASKDESQRLVPVSLAVEPTNIQGPHLDEMPPVHQPDHFVAPAKDFEPAGCSAPVDDYSPVQVGERILSVRTYGMLSRAATIKSSPIDLLDSAIISIDHPSKLLEIPDPHHDRGVLDISVRDPLTNRILYEEIDGLVRALRMVGFAAWLRDAGELHPGSEIHIHAVAIGDRELSRPALDQLHGKYGYFAGKKGFFDEAGTLDPHGGPIVCHWMREAGLGDFHQVQISPSGDILDWQERLRSTAQAFVTDSQEETLQIARGLGFQRNGQEDPSNMCGPLSAAILIRAGLLPSAAGPVTDLHNYWLADPLSNGRPWSLFPSDQYQIHRFSQSIERFDFSEWPLHPGDFVYSYSGHGAFSHMFVVTEVDGKGRRYTVTNQEQSGGNYLIERVLLYDPREPDAGVLRSTCEDCGSWRRRTGLGGFDVLRHTDLVAAANFGSSLADAADEMLPAFSDSARSVEGSLQGSRALNFSMDLPVSFLFMPRNQEASSSATQPRAANLDLAAFGYTRNFTDPTYGDAYLASPLH